MAIGYQFWSSQSWDLLTLMDFRHFYGHVEKILFADSQHKLFFIAYCLLPKLNLGSKNNFDKGFSLWSSLSRVFIFFCPTSIWNHWRPASNTTYSTHLWHFPPGCISKLMSLNYWLSSFVSYMTDWLVNFASLVGAIVIGLSAGKTANPSIYFSQLTQRNILGRTFIPNINMFF